MRTATVTRKTAETDIKITLRLDGSGKYSIDSGNGFFDHMLELFSFHSGFDLDVKCKGDTDVDFHHSAEDIGIALGQAFTEAVGDKKGLARYGSMIMPMDEALVIAAADISGRGCFGYGLELPAEQIGAFDTELVREFFTALCRTFGATLHLKQLAGCNTHHIIEASFKGMGRALKDALRVDGDRILSTKGVL